MSNSRALLSLVTEGSELGGPLRAMLICWGSEEFPVCRRDIIKCAATTARQRKIPEEDRARSRWIWKKEKGKLLPPTPGTRRLGFHLGSSSLILSGSEVVRSVWRAGKFEHEALVIPIRNSTFTLGSYNQRNENTDAYSPEEVQVNLVKEKKCCVREVDSAAIKPWSVVTSRQCCFGSPVSERTAAAVLNPIYNPIFEFQLKTKFANPPRIFHQRRLLEATHFNFDSAIFSPLLTSSSSLLCLLRQHLKLHRHSNNYFSTMASSSDKNGGGTKVRQNFPEVCEGLINKQINMELYASYVYMSMAYYFDRDDVAFPGLHKFFKKNSDEEREHAEKFMKYQNYRGGRVFLQPIANPTNDEWTSPLAAMTAALDLEKTVNQTLLELHKVAGENGDAHLCDFLEAEFLDEQVKAIKELSDYVTQLQRVGTGLGEYIFDKEFHE